jgi:hypothetical protein
MDLNPLEMGKRTVADGPERAGKKGRTSAASTMDVQATTASDKDSLTPTQATDSHQGLLTETEGDVISENTQQLIDNAYTNQSVEIEIDQEGDEGQQATKAPDSEKHEVTPAKESAAGETKETANDERKEDEATPMVTQDPPPDEDEMEQHMASVAQNANAAHQIRLQEMTDKKKGRSTAGNTTSFTSQGTFTMGKPKDRKVHDVLNKVLESFNDLKVQRTHISRYDIQFTIPESDVPEVAIYEAAVEIFKKLASADKRVVWYPWSATDAVGQNPKEKTLVSADQFPKNWGDMKQYLPGLRPKYEGGTVYSAIWMGSTKPLSKLMEEVGHWFRHNKHGLYLKHIQAEHQFVVGWGLYSLNTMDTTKLQQVLEERLGFPIHA